MTLLHSLQNNKIYAEGAKYISDALAVNQTVTELKYAAARPFPCRQCPLTLPLFLTKPHLFSSYSVEYNNLDDSAKELLKAAAGDRIKLIL